MKTDKRPITTRSYDMQGHSIWRVLLQDMISRTMPFGNFGGGPNLKYIARLLLLHTIGRPLVALVMWLRSRQNLNGHADRVVTK